MLRARRSLLVSVVFSLLTGAPRVGAEPVEGLVAWVFEAPATLGCLVPQELEAEVEVRLGRTVFVSEEERPANAMLLRTSLAQTGEHHVAHIELISPDGVALGARDLKAASCAELNALLPVVVSVFLDSEEARPGAEPARPQPSQAPSVPSASFPLEAADDSSPDDSPVGPDRAGDATGAEQPPRPAPGKAPDIPGVAPSEAPTLDPAGLDPAGLDPAGLDPAGRDPASRDPASLDPPTLPAPSSASATRSDPTNAGARIGTEPTSSSRATAQALSTKRPTLFCGAAVGLLAGYGPIVSARVRGACGFQPLAHFSLEVSGEWRAPSARSEPSFSVQGFGARAAACAKTSSRWRVGPCLGLGFSQTSGDLATDDGEHERRERFAFESVALFRLEYLQWPWLLQVDAGASFPAEQPRHVQRQPGGGELLLHQTWIAMPSLDFGIGYVFR